MYTFQIKFKSKKKYEPDIVRTAIIESNDLFSCETSFKKSYKEVDICEINMLNEDGNVIKNLL